MFSFSFWGVGSEGVLIGFFVVLKMRIDRMWKRMRRRDMEKEPF